MRIKIQLAAILLLTMGFMSSCIMKDGVVDCPPPRGSLKVVSKIDFGGGNALWPQGSAIGITVLKAGTNECFGDNSNKHYVVGDAQTGESVPNQSSAPIYLPEGDEKVDIVAYYPYATSFDENNMANLSVLDQSRPDLLDLITSDRVSNLASDTELIELKFYRRLTKLIFNINLIEIDAAGNEQYVNEKLPGTSLVVSGMPVTGVYSLSDNKLNIDGTVKDITTLMNQDGTNSSAIVFPRKASEGVTFVVTLPDGRQHTVLMSPTQELKAGTENTFDIVIKYKGDPLAKPTYNVTYELQGNLTPENIDVKYGRDNQAWGLNQTVIVKEGDALTFSYNSALAVSARLSDGTVLDTKNNEPYSFDNIHKNIHMILSATGEPTSYQMTYEFVDGLSSSNVTVIKDTNTPWPEGEVVNVDKGTSFTFLYHNNGGTVKSVVINEKIITNIQNGTPYRIDDISRNQHIIFGGAVNYEVKLWFNLPNIDPSTTTVSTLVVHNGKYKFNIPSTVASEKVIITINGVKSVLTPDAEGWYTIEGIDEDKSIVITVKKAVNSPDAFITADIHEWTILTPIDGGVIYPIK